MKDILDNERTLSPHSRFLKKHGLYTAAVYYKNMNEPHFLRAAHVTNYILDKASVPKYKGELLPFIDANIYNGIHDDVNGYGLIFSTDGFPWINAQKFERLRELCENSAEENIYRLVYNDSRAAVNNIAPCRYDHGGTHNIPDIPTVLQNGLFGYQTKIDNERKHTDDVNKLRFLDGMEEVLQAVINFVGRYVENLEKYIPETDKQRENHDKLLSAMKKVPFYPAESFYEAVVSCYCVMYLTCCYEPGRIDEYLYPYYQKELDSGKISKDDAVHLFRLIMEDLDQHNGHPAAVHVTIGGTDRDGNAVYNDLTEAALVAIRGLRMPNLTLRVRKDMPQKIWDLVLYNLGKGFSHPALVNEKQFLEYLTSDYNIPYHDAVNYVFGGCSEVLIQGKTMCDSTWVQYNMLDVFEQTFYNKFLDSNTFDEFLEAYKSELKLTLKELEQCINARQLKTGMFENATLRTLFADGCIENGKGFSEGGARYNFDSTNVYGATNAINSLYTLKAFYEGKFGDVTKEQLIDAMIANYVGYEHIHAKCKSITKFGNYDPQLNKLASELMDFVFTNIMDLRCWRENKDYVGRFIPSIILWVDWISSGKRVGATPDGRVLGEATVDSCGPMQGTDIEGPTSTMGAALSLPQFKCIGTCVLNLRLDAANFSTPEKISKVQQLFQVYFAQGGNQLQINVVDSETLKDALINPEKHKDIIVRVGGFSDNFVMLDKDIQKEILRRTEHQV